MCKPLALVAGGIKAAIEKVINPVPEFFIKNAFLELFAGGFVHIPVQVNHWRAVVTLSGKSSHESHHFIGGTKLDRRVELTTGHTSFQ